ncbi:hypothetical protein THAOC_04969 [Thalassiosira oceanica]|uniref:Uncharacterized protein n=1 Tax=Thalassiosira oceanica TaxID=159749 RepID=K0T8G4_THAOC|nr:hypothetical protein THAOC_04969 [Thalassiosira oceanica]|eukprot:EJK73409.1 hypothetical protein THAOC_04969 [Thalassiosira oceanica]
MPRRGATFWYPARPSALYTPTGPLGRSVASVNLKQPSMHRRSSVCRLRCARDPSLTSAGRSRDRAGHAGKKFICLRLVFGGHHQALCVQNWGRWKTSSWCLARSLKVLGRPISQISSQLSGLTKDSSYCGVSSPRGGELLDGTMDFALLPEYFGGSFDRDYVCKEAVVEAFEEDTGLKVGSGVAENDEEEDQDKVGSPERLRPRKMRGNWERQRISKVGRKRIKNTNRAEFMWMRTSKDGLLGCAFLGWVIE